jgi:hypothetical protein
MRTMNENRAFVYQDAYGIKYDVQTSKNTASVIYLPYEYER